MAKKKTTPRSNSKKKAGASVQTKSTPAGSESKLTGPPEQGDSPSGYALTDAEIEQDLISGENRDLLEACLGEEAFEDLRALALRAQSSRVRGGPHVLILPGIMGSTLGTKGFFDDTLWIDPVDIIRGRLAALSLDGGSPDIQPLGVLLFAYLKLKLRLKLAGFDAEFHPYDWRRDIRTLGRDLAKRIVEETGDGRPSLYLVAHSMGGLVSRAGFKRLEDSGNPQDANRVQRLIMLGTPNNGSFSPVQALSGTHSMVKKVAAIDLSNSRKDLVNEVFNTFTGLYQMLPARSVFSGLDLYDPANWPPTGMGPRSAELTAAPEVHDALAAGRNRFILIAGINQETIVSVRRDGDELLYGLSLEGDGTVPLAFAQLANVTTYFVEEEHGSLPNNSAVQRAVIDLLETGRTSVLKTSWTPGRRGVLREAPAAQLAPEPFDGRRGDRVSRSELRRLVEEFAAPPHRAGGPVSAAPAIPVKPVTDEPIVIGRKRQQRFDVRLAHGGITQVDTRALVLGLFSGVAPSGAARAVDQMLDGVISEFTERRMLSARVGEAFMMPANRYRMGADMVAFVGLGTYDDFDVEVLRLAAENVARALVRTKVDEFATVLMSSGSGIETAEVLANLISGFLRGIRDGDERGHLRGVTFCESDPERFEQMHREMLRLSTTSLFDAVEATVETLTLPPPAPAVSAATPRAAGRARDPVYLIVREMPDLQPRVTATDLAASFTLRASVLTAGGRATVVTDTVDVEGKALNDCLQFIETKGFDYDSLEGFGTRLADLVLPTLARKALKAKEDRNLVVIHDARTSRIPWETVYADGRYLSDGAGLSRKYEAEDLSVGRRALAEPEDLAKLQHGAVLLQHLPVAAASSAEVTAVGQYRARIPSTPMSLFNTAIASVYR